MSNKNFKNKYLLEKWDSILNNDAVPPIKDQHRKNVTAILLENQEQFSASQRETLMEAPTNSAGTGGYTNAAAAGGAVAGYDPVLISMIRRSMPYLMAYDFCGVQPMTAPSGTIFALRSHFGTDRDGNGASPNVFTNELFYDEAETGRSNAGGTYTGVATDLATNPGLLNPDAGSPAPGAVNGYTTAGGMNTSALEALGDSAGTQFREVGFSIEKMIIEAKGRALKAEYSLELQQDLKAVHGLDAESELANILSTEITAEINREVLRTIYIAARPGAQNNVVIPGQFDLDLDSNGRWSVEKFKGLAFQLERDANAIGQTTRRGKGNFAIVSADVASALALAKVLDYAPAMISNELPDDTQNTFVGVLNGNIRVYVDPYAANISNLHFAVLGYKGGSPWDAGIFYSPYVGLEMFRAVGQDTFQPKIGFKTRYAISAHPFAGGKVQRLGQIVTNENVYYRRLTLKNLM